MKKKLLIILLTLFSNLIVAQEAFYIENYHVDIELHTNGSFDVTETINVFFTEERRGIIRDIPCRFTFDAFTSKNRIEMALGASSEGQYETWIDSINVADYNFSVSDNGYNKSIRIGSADKFINGAHKYIIKYSVRGAINEFINHSEFSWNIIGHEWKTEIKKASFSLSFEKELKLKKQDIILMSGIGDSTDVFWDENYSISSSEIEGSTREPLKPKEAITLKVKLPWNYFNNRYRIKKYFSNINLEKDGSFRITNIQQNEYIGYQQYNLDRFQASIKSPTNKVYEVRTSNSALYDSVLNMYAWINGLRRTLESYKQGISTKLFRINIINGKTEFKNGEGLLWKWDMEDFYQKVDTFIIQLDLLKHVKPKSIELTKSGKPVNYAIENGKLNAEISDLNPTDILLLKVVYPKWTYSEPLPPKHAIYDSEPYFVITNFDDEIFINNDATLRIKRKYYVDFRDPIKAGENIPFDVYVGSFVPYYDDYTTDHHYFLIENAEYNNAKYSRDYLGFSLSWGEGKEPETRNGAFEFEYTTYNMLRKDGGEFFMNIPLYEDESFPVVKGKLLVHFPKTIESEEVKYMFNTLYKREPNYVINKQVINDTTIQFEFQLEESVRYLPSWPILNFRFPKGNIKTSFKKDAAIFLDTYDDEVKSLLVPLIITFVLFVIWFFLGRDKKHEIEEKHYIPENISPPEVGYIWDGKLHKRDLISLIYYWAAQGYLKISDIYSENDEIILTKVKSLPKDRKVFEHIIFKGLFKSQNEVKVSSLRDSFYKTMKSAAHQFKRYSRLNKLLMPGTKAFGRILMIIGILCGIICLIIGLAEEEVFILIYALLLATPFIIFGIIMPKFGHLGAKMHREVLGFRKFIEKAEVDRLLFILEENPDYFDQTIAYAIVMGMGKTWAKKFNGLINSKDLGTKNGGDDVKDLTESPLEKKLDTLFYVDTMIKRMHKIEDDFHYKKPTPRSTYSSFSGSSYSYKSSSSSSSYSSSSSGGSSSYGSSGGGYSGSGYGGGGGSSW